MFIITITRKQYCVNDIRTAADIVYGELGNERIWSTCPIFWAI